jgi:hypothetical protein
MFIYELFNIILPNVVIEWLLLLLHICEVSGSKMTWRQAIFTEVLLWFPLVIQGTGYKAMSFLQVMASHSHKQFVHISLNSNIQISDLISMITFSD